MRTIHKVLIEQKTGKKYLVKDLQDNFHTSEGVILAKDLKSKKEIIFSNKNQPFTVIDPLFPDLWEQLQRGPQVMLPKDIGLIIAKTGINKYSKAVDAGGGSGSLCLYLAHLCKEVTTYETSPENIEILHKNKKLFGANNLNIKKENIYLGISEKEIDFITLDLPEPWKVINPAEKSLKMGAFLVVYLPNLIQAKTFIESASGTKIKVLEIIELMERKWVIGQKIMRPEFQMLGHTGFLIFCRKF